MLPSAVAWPHVNLNLGITGGPSDPPASIPSINPCVGSPEVTESLTLTTSSSGIDKKESAGTIFSRIDWAIADVSIGTGSSLARFSIAGNGFYILLIISVSVPLNQFLYILTHSINSSPHLLLTLTDYCYSFLQLLKGGIGILVDFIYTCFSHMSPVALPFCPIQLWIQSSARSSLFALLDQFVPLSQSGWCYLILYSVHLLRHGLCRFTVMGIEYMKFSDWITHHHDTILKSLTCLFHKKWIVQQ